MCNLYETCNFINEDSCSMCVTGEVDCPICGLGGMCEDTAIHYEVVSSETECEVNFIKMTASQLPKKSPNVICMIM